jgi:WD40 repeat protein
LLIAVGDIEGRVTIYSLSDDRSELKYSHELKMNPTGASVNPITEVSSLAWSSDGKVLAVGWLNGGISLWSAFGKLLFSNYPEETMYVAFIPSIFFYCKFAHIRNPKEYASKNFDSFLIGAKDVFWASGNFELFILPSCSYDNPGKFIKRIFGLNGFTCFMKIFILSRSCNLRWSILRMLYVAKSKSHHFLTTLKRTT